MSANFLVLSDLPAADQAQIAAISAIASSRRTAAQTAYLNARAAYTSNGIIESDSSGNILRCSGTTIPTNATAGFAKNCHFLKADAAAGTSGMYVNVGTTASCDFRLVTNA